jgi:citrate synthase
MDERLDYVTAEEAIALLGVKRPTLYSYVSRGLVRSVPGDGRRARRYVRADLERIRGRRDARAGHAALARAALDWGEPVLDSALTEITERGPAPRGRLVSDLVERGVGFEQASELLWTGSLPATTPQWKVTSLGFDARRLAKLLPDRPAPFSVLSLAMTALARAGMDGPVLIPRLAASLAMVDDPARVTASLAQPTVAARLLHALGSKPTRASVRAIDAALVASLDHELNPSSFVARVAAAAGADMPSCLTAALATLSGARHGGQVDRVEMLLDAIGSKGHARGFVDERLQHGEAIPGFGHRLYPQGDPRATLLLDVARGLGRRSARLDTILSLVRAMQESGQEPPTLDLGLAAVTAALGLPRGAPIVVFALGRTAGWIAHVVEQRESGQVLRPRARYVGPRSG